MNPKGNDTGTAGGTYRAGIGLPQPHRARQPNVERWERGRAKARERAERKAAKKNLSAAAVM